MTYTHSPSMFGVALKVRQTLHEIGDSRLHHASCGDKYRQFIPAQADWGADQRLPPR